MFSHAASTHDRRRSFRWSAWAASLAAHVVTALLAIGITAIPPPVAAPASPHRITHDDLVWLVTPGSGGGGGGGGDQTPFAAAARQRGDDRRTVPSIANARSDAPPQPLPVQTVLIPAQPMAAGFDDMPGLMQATHVSGTAQGPGTGGGAGDRRGVGSGDGVGAGAGPGTDQGIGGGPSGGSDLTQPQLVREVKPNYTAEAMRARVQGAVLLECVVLPDGTVGDVRVLESLDRTFGLDEQALEAARQWRFLPATRRGRPVSVRITIEIAFTLR